MYSWHNCTRQIHAYKASAIIQLPHPQGKEGRDVLCQWPCQRSSRWPLTSGDQSSRKPNPAGWISVRSGTENLSPRVFDSAVSSCIYCCCFSLLPGMVWVGVGISHYLMQYDRLLEMPHSTGHVYLWIVMKVISSQAVLFNWSNEFM